MTNELISKPEASRRGLSVAGATPAEYRTERFHRIGQVTYALYSLQDLKPKRTQRQRPAEAVDLLAAIFAANRTAKRYRDAAQSHYRAGTHGFARTSRETKEILYELKDAGIAAAVRAGRLLYCGRHGNLAIYRGEGYCFHSTLEPLSAIPPTTPGPESEPLFVEAKPKSAKEPRLVDATFTLRAAGPLKLDGFRRLTPARHPKREKEDDEDWQ